jgi:hypothetical protein
VPRLARTFGSLVLSGWGLSRLTDDYELVVSELTANVVQAVTGPDGQPHHDLSRHLPGLGLCLLSDHERLRVEVWDDLPLTLGVPALRQADAEDENGRGLELVAALSHDWGWEPLPGDNTKRVWATLPR